MIIWIGVAVVAVMGLGVVGWLVGAVHHDLGDLPAKRAIEVLLGAPKR